MRIAVYHNLPPGGALRWLTGFGRQLSRHHAIDLFALDGRHGIGESRRVSLDRKGLEVPRGLRPWARGPLYWMLLSRGLSRYEALCREVASAIDAGRYDLAWIDGCEWTRVPPVARHLARTPAVVYFHDPLCPPSAAGGIQRRFEERLWRLWKDGVGAARAVFANSEFTREYLRKHGVESRVVQAGIDTERFSPKPGSRENVIFLPGAAWPFKGHDLLVEAVARLPDRDRLQLLFTGGRGDPAYRAHVERLAREKGVRAAWHGPVSDDDLVRHYRTSLAVVSPSRNEPLGLVPLESQACGTPVVASREGGHLETVKDRETGFLVERTPEAFAETIGPLVRDAALRERMGRSAVRWIGERWSAERANALLDPAIVEAARG